MLGNLDERLSKAKLRLRSQQKFEAMLRQAQQTVLVEQAKCSDLKDKLEREQADVDKLEGLSLTGLFYSVLGAKSEQIEKERQEFLAAKLKYDEAVDSLEDAEQEEQRIRAELAPFAGANAEYDRLLVEKEDLLTGAGDDRAKELLAMSEQLADLDSDRKELNEAIRAGHTALSSLQKVSSELQSAANWGTWDMFGGGMVSTMAKHSKIDSAKECARQAQRQLRRFQEELADADQRLHVALDIGGFSKFADFFFDGLIADWVVQTKISEATSACSSTKSKVSSAINECQQRLSETEKEIEKLNSRRQAFIERA